MDITAAIITAFRTAYPEFSDTPTWPDSLLTRALCAGDSESGGCGWGAYGDDCHNFKQRGMFAYAAHWLVSFYPKGATGSVAVGAKNVVAGKTVGDESVTFATPDTSKLADGKAWFYVTAYGQEFLRLQKRAGMGARAV